MIDVLDYDHCVNSTDTDDRHERVRSNTHDILRQSAFLTKNLQTFLTQNKIWKAVLS